MTSLKPKIIKIKDGLNGKGGKIGTLALFKCYQCKKQWWEGISQNKIYCSQKCYSKHRSKRTGELAPCWKGGHNKKEITRNWIKNNKERFYSLIRKRDKRLKNSEGSHTVQEWKKLKEKCNNTCVCCNKINVKLTRDHIIPLIKGGSDYIKNIQPLCRNCNSKKYYYTINYLEKYLEKFLK